MHAQSHAVSHINYKQLSSTFSVNTLLTTGWHKTARYVALQLSRQHTQHTPPPLREMNDILSGLVACIILLANGGFTSTITLFLLLQVSLGFCAIICHLQRKTKQVTQVSRSLHSWSCESLRLQHMAMYCACCHSANCSRKTSDMWRQGTFLCWRLNVPCDLLVFHPHQLLF